MLVHGFPDSHVLWDGVVPLLAERFRIIRYDNRGVGQSSVPKPVSAYTMARFADDFAAVIGELSPGPARARAGPRLGLGGHVGVPDPAGCRRPRRLVHVGVRPEPGPTGRLHLQRSAPTVAPAAVCPLDQPGVCDSPTCGSSRSRCWRRCCFGRRCPSPALRRNVVDNIPDEQIHHSANLASDAANSVKIYPANYFRSFSGRGQGITSSTCRCS